jgi:hypothetical protein
VQAAGYHFHGRVVEVGEGAAGPDGREPGPVRPFDEVVNLALGR